LGWKATEVATTNAKSEFLSGILRIAGLPCGEWQSASLSDRINVLILGDFVKAIRASDIGSYLYCRRAWWYRRNGFESINQAELAAGTDLHRSHGRKVIVAGFYRTLAMVILLIALVLLAAYGTSLLFK
jgi:hypothetical protein